MATSTKTSQELIYEAAHDIGAIGPGEAMSAEDYAKFDGKLDSLLDQLNEQYSISIYDKEQIPAAYFMALARLLGNVAGAAIVAAPLNNDAWERDVAALRRMASTRPTGQVLKTDYF